MSNRPQSNPRPASKPGCADTPPSNQRFASGETGGAFAPPRVSAQPYPFQLNVTRENSKWT